MHGSGEGLVNIRLSLCPRSAHRQRMLGRFDGDELTYICAPDMGLE